MKLRHVMYFLLALAIAGISYSAVSFIVLKPASFASISTGSTEDGDVLIEITPLLTKGKLQARITATTHSVELNQFNLQEITTLETNGLSVAPTAAPALGGHHTAGTLVFDAEVGNTFMIRIRGIPQVEERTYAWTI